jgi:hypothetical protein
MDEQESDEEAPWESSMRQQATQYVARQGESRAEMSAEWALDDDLWEG